MNRGRNPELPAFGCFLGPDKSGSSWLQHAAQLHPEVSAPEAKDLFYFDHFYGRGTDWYERQFATMPTTKVHLEICHDYLFSDEACARIADYCPDARLIVCLRHPVDRARSAYQYMRRQGRTRTSFSQALMTVPELIDHARYGNHLSRYTQVFRADQILLLDFAELEVTPNRFWERVCHHLSVTPVVLGAEETQPIRTASEARHFLAARYGRRLGWTLRRMRLERVVASVKDSRVVSAVLFKEPSEVPTVSPADIDVIRESLRNDTQQLDSEWGTDYTERWWT